MLERTQDMEAYMALPEMMPDKYLLYRSVAGESDEQILQRLLYGKNATDGKAIVSSRRQHIHPQEITAEELANLFLRLEAEEPKFPLFRGGNFNVFKKDWSFSLSFAHAYVKSEFQEGPERTLPVLAVMTVGDFMQAVRKYHHASGYTLQKDVMDLIQVGPWGWDYPHRHCRIAMTRLMEHGCIPKITQYRRLPLSPLKSA